MYTVSNALDNHSGVKDGRIQHRGRNAQGVLHACHQCTLCRWQHGVQIPPHSMACIIPQSQPVCTRALHVQ